MPFLPPDKLYRPSVDLAGIASLMGGDYAVSAMIAVHVYGNSRWLGWYNTPGSFQVAKRLNSLAKSSPSNTLSNSVQIDFATFLELDHSKGPKFRGVHSGTVMQDTSYLATLFMKECSARASEESVVSGRLTQPVGITIAELGQAPDCEMHPARSSPFILLLASIPVVTSIYAFTLCVVWESWCAALLIFIGIAASGLSGLVLGSADFVFTHPKTAAGSPPGDGILSSGKTIVLLRGTEDAVNSITRGSFSLRFLSVAHCDRIRWCSFLFFFQCITQLSLASQVSSLGHVMLLTSLGVSALCNAWLSSSDKEKIHRKMLFEQVLRNPTLTKYTFGTYTTAMVFMVLVLKLSDPAVILYELLPNESKVWRQWKKTILKWLPNPSDQFLQQDCLDEFSEDEKKLLEMLFADARSAYACYERYLQIRRLDIM